MPENKDRRDEQRLTADLICKPASQSCADNKTDVARGKCLTKHSCWKLQLGGKPERRHTHCLNIQSFQNCDDKTKSNRDPCACPDGRNQFAGLRFQVFSFCWTAQRYFDGKA